MTYLTLILALAVRLSGECGAIGDQCTVAVARTMANRYVQDYDLPAVLDAYHGRAAPTVGSTAVAVALLRCPRCLADGRNYYVWSDADMATMGWPAGDASLCGSGLCVHLAHAYPGSRK